MEEKSVNSAGSDIIFALDIGTRSVIGVVGRLENDIFQVLAIETEQHTKRAVVDGQIEDIEQTAKVAEKVKKRLEEKISHPLKEVCVAAAGRALKTYVAVHEMEMDAQEAISEAQIMELEAGAIDKTYQLLAEQEGEQANQKFLCVGHSVVEYRLDGYVLSNLLEHRGQAAEVELIATYLPSEVIKSLYTVMERIGLVVSGITLEPIAAMNAIIPQELRLLNLALVDIGGGTSDIAISNSGSVIAYTMATTAGDEISETIMQEYLVDFETAEKMKLSLAENQTMVCYQDILGFEYEITNEELFSRISSAVLSLAEEIAGRIVEANKKPPAAVFLVGGGSQVPRLCSMLAQALQIDEKKVAVGGNNYMKRMVSSELDISGPEFATPMGIALTAVKERSGRGLFVELNGKKLALIQNGTTTLLEVLLLAGYQYGQIVGHSGTNTVFTLNREKQVIRGGLATPAEIMINGAEATVTSPVSPGDKIEFVPASSGMDASPMVSDVVNSFYELTIFLNGFEYTAGTKVKINQMEAPKSKKINNGDQVEVMEVLTLGELGEWLGVDQNEYELFINEKKEGAAYHLKPGDDVKILERAQPPEQIAEADESALPEEKEEPKEEPIKDTPKRGIHILLNGAPFYLPEKEDGSKSMFVDALAFVDIDPRHPQGNVLLRLNGKNASYLDLLKEGDEVLIDWTPERSKSP